MDSETVEHVALLARLQLNETESESIRSDLTRILDHAKKLSQLDTTDVEPLAHPGDIVNALRDDETKPSFPREELLKNSPKSSDEFYLVPAVLGTKS